MKALEYLFFSCFNGGGKENVLKKRQLELELEKESILVRDQYSDLPGVDSSSKSMHPLYYSIKDGTTLNKLQKIMEMKSEVELLDVQLKKVKHV